MVPVAFRAANASKDLRQMCRFRKNRRVCGWCLRWCTNTQFLAPQNAPQQLRQKGKGSVLFCHLANHHHSLRQSVFPTVEQITGVFRFRQMLYFLQRQRQSKLPGTESEKSVPYVPAPPRGFCFPNAHRRSTLCSTVCSRAAKRTPGWGRTPCCEPGQLR